MPNRKQLPAPNPPETEQSTSHDPKQVALFGKESVRRDEVQPLIDFGRLIARLGWQLITTKTKGAPEHLVTGYEMDKTMTARYLKKGETLDPNIPTIVFTNSAMLKEKGDAFAERDWTVINNPKETADAARYLRIIAHSKGISLPDGGNTR